MRFTKMHGLGNDYLYVYGAVPPNVSELSQKLSDRHFGAGSDGMIYICPSAVADFQMRIFNADGSEAKMCGNGIRCVGKYVYDKGYTDKTTLNIETGSGIRRLNLQILGGKVRSVSVEMGKATPDKDKIIDVEGRKIVCTPVDVGNPHAVIFVDNIENAPLTPLGPKIEKHPAFPGGVNVEFAQVLSPVKIRMRVWERGSGVTMACGTGACASAAAAVYKGFCNRNDPIAVELDGGTLAIEIDQYNDVTMTGPAATVYEGDVAI